MTRRGRLEPWAVLLALLAFWCGVFVILCQVITYTAPEPEPVARNEWGQTYEDAEAARAWVREW